MSVLIAILARSLPQPRRNVKSPEYNRNPAKSPQISQPLINTPSTLDTNAPRSYTSPSNTNSQSHVSFLSSSPEKECACDTGSFRIQ